MKQNRNLKTEIYGSIKMFSQVGGERRDHSTNFVGTLPYITYKINYSDELNN